MFWVQLQAKYHQSIVACYDPACPEHRGKEGENWGTFTPEECDRIIHLSTKVPQGHVTVTGKVQPDYRQVTMWRVPYNEETHWIWDKLTKNVILANNQWWNFDISGIIEPLQLLCYDAGNGDGSYQDHYSKHIDVGSIAPNRKITFSVQLSDPKDYDGAELHIYRYRDPEALPTGKGTMILFPSYMLHEVTPITRGKRWALVCWMSGPQFR